MKPHLPESTDPITAETLREMQGQSWASSVVLGGHFALKHYLRNDYRQTHDIDLWWKQHLSDAERDRTSEHLRDVMHIVAKRCGLLLHERQWNTVTSFELQEQGSTVFSLQIATRFQRVASLSNDARIEVLRHLESIEMRRPMPI